jgi:nitrate/nitrite transporter NarK
LIGAFAVAAVFTEAGNGANFAVVPHVHPANNGIVSGLTGAAGNLGGIVFNLVFRFNGTNYHKAYWIMGVISLILPLSVSWIRAPKVYTSLGQRANGSYQERLVGGASLDLDTYRGVWKIL